MNNHTNSSPIIVALDYANGKEALELVAQLDSAKHAVKVGKELFLREGPSFVQALATNFRVFLDLKFHDIPNTVAKACAAAANLGVWMLTLHVTGGTAMMRAAREAIDTFTNQPPLLLGVTVLTSFTEADLLQQGIKRSISEQVIHYAAMAASSGLDGVISSPLEVAQLRKNMPEGFLIITPGIRPVNVKHDDQVRVATPKQAVRAGADYLVIGRAITKASNPQQVLAQIEAEL